MARNSEIADLGANFPTGHVIQTKYFSTDTAVTSQNTDNTTDSWVDVLTAANITMSSQSNKILIYS